MTKSHFVEVSTGVRVKVWKSEDATRPWSCDGEHFFGTLPDAYEDAKKRGVLVFEQEADDTGFHTWVAGLLMELKALDPGASIKLTRYGNEFHAVREQPVLPPLKASELTDLEFRLEEE